MDTLADDDDGTGVNFISRTILSDKIPCGDKSIEVHVTDDLNSVVGVEQFDTIFPSLEHNPNSPLWSFDKIVFLKAMYILLADNLTVMEL